ncbi:MAG: class I SAM-dependent methyltransferase [Actinomycetota bacterium]
MTAALVADDGTEIPLRVSRWIQQPSPAEQALLRLARSPVLDVGCGPGRHVLSLALSGHVALGVDASPVAVELATRRGAPVLLRSIFDRIPGLSRWGSALLLDGNLGIGGDAVQLLARTRELLRVGGLVLCEVDPPGTRTRRVRVQVRSRSGTSQPFPWSIVGAQDLARLASEAGLHQMDLWGEERRWFACLEYRPR